MCLRTVPASPEQYAFSMWWNLQFIQRISPTFVFRPYGHTAPFICWNSFFVIITLKCFVNVVVGCPVPAFPSVASKQRRAFGVPVVVAAAGREINGAVIVVAILAHVPVDAVVALVERFIRIDDDWFF